MFPTKWKNENLNLQHLKSFLDIDIKEKTFALCGNYGDPIYYDQLFDVVDYLKEKQAIVEIVTNGSYRTKEWWEELASRLTSDDSVILSIDGLPENFTEYRINAEWKSILTGISVLANSPVKLVWKYIIFSYNQNNIKDAEELSKTLGFNEFSIIESDRFDGENDYLKPNMDELGSRGQQMILWKTQWKKKIEDVEISPKCKLNDQHFISAQGYYMPCCFVGSHKFYYKSEFYNNKEMYDISNTTISQILQLDRVIDFYNTLEDVKLNYCTFNCPKL
jgi:MoaA/NifB/PqqE/SkfB family radical SAM enzyme